MYDVMKIRLKRRIATRSGKGNQPLNIKKGVEWPILKLGYPNFRWSFYFILLLFVSLLFRRIFMTSQHDTFQHFLYKQTNVFLDIAYINKLANIDLVDLAASPLNIIIFAGFFHAYHRLG